VKQGERIASLETALKTLAEKQSKDFDVQEGYRNAVHDRFVLTHGMINVHILKDQEAHEDMALKIHKLNHSNETVTKAFEQFESFIVEARNTFKTMNDFMLLHAAKSDWKKDLISGTIKLVGFAATVIGIIKYLE
jgi:hypothetical protein